MSIALFLYKIPKQYRYPTSSECINKNAKLSENWAHLAMDMTELLIQLQHERNSRTLPRWRNPETTDWELFSCLHVIHSGEATWRETRQICGCPVWETGIECDYKCTEGSLVWWICLKIYCDFYATYTFSRNHWYILCFVLILPSFLPCFLPSSWI